MVTFREQKIYDNLINHEQFMIVGRVGMDLYPVPDGTTIAEATQFQTDIGGSAGNIAVAIAKAGESAALISGVSDDAVGAFVRRKLAFYQVKDDYIGTVKGQSRTSLALAETIADNPEVVIYRNNASDLILDDTHLSSVDFSTAKALIITGTALSATKAKAQILALATRAQQAHCPVMLDIDYRAMAWPDKQPACEALQELCPLVDVMIGNDDEFAILANGSVAQGYDHAKELAGTGMIVLYKKGAEGCEILCNDAHIHTGIYPVTIYKPFGAGDAFLGNLVAALAKGVSFTDAVRTGAAAAAMVVSRPGCASAMPDEATLKAFMSSSTMTP